MYTGVEISAWLNWQSIALGSLMGILIPIFSAILPIRHALSQNLHESLGKHAAAALYCEVYIHGMVDSMLLFALSRK